MTKGHGEYFENDGWDIISQSDKENNNLQIAEKVYETKTYIDGSELAEYKNGLNAIYPNGIKSIYPIDFLDKYRVIEDEESLKDTRNDINAISISVPPIVSVQIDNEVYKEYIIHLYKTCLNKAPSDEELNTLLNREAFAVTKDIMLNNNSNATQLDNFEFVDLLFYCVLGRQATVESIEKYAGYIDNEQCSKEDLIGTFLMSEEFTEATVKSFKNAIKKNKVFNEFNGNDGPEAVLKRENLKTEKINQDVFNAYMAQVYLVTLGNNETCISNERLEELYNYYNSGYDLEECLIKMFSTTAGSKFMSRMSDAGNEQYVNLMYEAILGNSPNACMKEISQKNLQFEKRFEWAKRNIIYSSEFKDLKTNLANGIYEPIKFLNEKKVSVDICTKVKGDLNGDLEVNAQDARLILKVIVDASIGNDQRYMPYMDYLDINGDGQINTIDAQYVLEYYAYSIKTDKAISLAEYMNL